MTLAKKSFKTKIKSAIYTLLAFLLSFLIFFISLCFVLKVTFLNPDFIYDNMNTSHYFADKKDEVTQTLIDLGYASGLNESFFENFVDEVMINEDTHNYIMGYYEGKTTEIDTTNFKQSFNSALNDYIVANSIENVNSSSREYLIKEAAKLYRNSLELPIFTTIAPYVRAINSYIIFIMLGLVLFMAIICIVMIFTNKWKHRALKYFYYSTSGAFLAIAIIPITAFITGFIKKINLESRSLYNLVVQGVNNIMIATLICAIVFLLISIALYFAHKAMRKKAV